MEQKILFNFDNDVNRNFFKDVPGLGAVTYNGHPVTKKADSIVVYISSFSEKHIEKDHLLEYTELNDSTQIPFSTYIEVTGYSQDLHILKYTFTYTAINKKTGKSFNIPVEAAAFFSIKRNRDGNTIGITPCYYGVINAEDNLIAFDTELSLKKEKGHYYLKPLKKTKKMNGLLFMPADFLSDPQTGYATFNIEKIVKLDANKVGGYKPLIFDISNIFHDSNALQFHYYTTLHLSQ